MFHQIYTACKPPKVPVTVHSRHPRRPRNGLVCCP